MKFRFRSLFTIITLVLTLVSALQLRAADSNQALKHAKVIAESNSGIVVSFQSPDIQQTQGFTNNSSFTEFTIPDESNFNDPGNPQMPCLSRMVIVPPRAGIAFDYNIQDSEFLENAAPPVEGLIPGTFMDAFATDPDQFSLFPPAAVTVSDPVILRGVRLVQVTVYPVQYNLMTGEYVHNQNIDVSLQFTNDKPVNPVEFTGVRRNQSLEFQKLLDALALNSTHPGRDTDEIGREYNQHYLVVTREECLPYAIPFLEWKRRSGNKVDILSYSADEAIDMNSLPHSQELVADIHADIQELYDSYLEEGNDPFDHLLIIGDRRATEVHPGDWRLDSFTGNSTMPDTPPHADYMFGLLEGDDNIPDVAIGRIGSGSEDMMELAIARLLSYESAPWMEDTDWFSRGGVFSQNWGEDFNMTLPLTTRWGERVLDYLDYDEILIQEATGEADPNGNQIGPVLANWYNQGINVMIGRASLYYWHYQFSGVQNNTIYPIFINSAGHGEFAMQVSFRSGDIDNLKGPSTCTAGWGDPRTVYNNAAWMTMVSGFFLHDMTLGWARTYFGSVFHTIFPFDEGDGLITAYQTDTDLYGDPGIQHWIGVPQRVQIEEFPEVLNVGTDYFEIRILDEENNPVDGAHLTLYQPGETPEDEDYADWAPDLMVTTTSNNGIATITLPEGLNEGTLYITVTGRSIYPLQEEVEVQTGASNLAVSGFSLVDDEDNIITAGETTNIRLTVINYGNEQEVENVTGIVTSASPWLEVAENQIHFGNIAASAEADGEEDVEIRISGDCPDNSMPYLSVELSDGNRTWQSSLVLDVMSTNLEISEIVGGDLIEEQLSDINPVLINLGRINASGIHAELISESWAVSVIEGEREYPDIEVGETGQLPGDNPFQIGVSNLAIPGMKALMVIVFNLDDGIIDTARFELTLFEPAEGDPLGPDDYGYVCFDDSDGEWNMAPIYDEIEISLDDDDRYFDGTLVNMGEVNGIAAVEMPFPLVFYGHEYDSITVCANGFIGVGNQRRMINYQNYPVDLAIGGPLGIIAPFWTNLQATERSGVYTYYDERSEIFIIEWYRFSPPGSQEALTFQVILFNPDYWHTYTGDANILFQYKLISQFVGNVPLDMPYASVGISSPDGTTGLSYTYWNNYPVNADPLEPRTAILFTTMSVRSRSVICGYVYDSITEEIVPGALLTSNYGFIIQSDETGYYCIETLNFDSLFQLDAFAPGYRGSRIEVDSLNMEQDSLNADIYLLRPVIASNRDQVDEFLTPEHEAQRFVRYYNVGTGVLYYFPSAESDANIEWFAFDPQPDSISAGDSLDFEFTINTSGLENGDYTLDLVIDDPGVMLTYSIPVYVNVDPANGLSDPGDVPLEWALNVNYPNPFNSTTSISFSIRENAVVDLGVFDLTGRRVATLANGSIKAGRYSVTFEGDNLPSGVYIYKLKAGSFTSVKKMALIR